MSGQTYKAVIERPGFPGRREPYARLEDGRLMPMGWNMGDRFCTNDTGTAEYVMVGGRGLWRFTLDPICQCWNEGEWGRVHREDCPLHKDGAS